MKTDDPIYTHHLERKSSQWWKRLFNVQAPYRHNLRRLNPGFCLDVGCGIGRNLAHLEGNGIGIDSNGTSVDMARKRGFKAFHPDEFKASQWNHLHSFDSLLLSHVVEHMFFEEASQLIGDYLPYVKQGGSVILITPQEAGFRADPTHVEFMDFEKLERLVKVHRLEIKWEYSFPFPRFVGGLFAYNEFVLVANT